jgi:hypothetical protein
MKSLVGAQLTRQAALRGANGILITAGIFTGTPDRPMLNAGWEAITQPIYDYHDYATGGATYIPFFQQAQGNNGTTAADTNMPGSGSFPRGQMFLVDGLEVNYISGAHPVTAGIGTVATSQINDTYAVMNGKGYLSLTVGTRPYLSVGPLSQFPPSFRVTGVAATSAATTAAATTLNIDVDLAAVTGDSFQLIPYLLQETVNFNISLNFPTAIPVVTAGRIGINMNGVLYRRNQ